MDAAAEIEQRLRRAVTRSKALRRLAPSVELPLNHRRNLPELCELTHHLLRVDGATRVRRFEAQQAQHKELRREALGRRNRGLDARQSRQIEVGFARHRRVFYVRHRKRWMIALL